MFRRTLSVGGTEAYTEPPRGTTHQAAACCPRQAPWRSWRRPQGRPVLPALPRRPASCPARRPPRSSPRRRPRHSSTTPSPAPPSGAGGRARRATTPSPWRSGARWAPTRGRAGVPGCRRRPPSSPSRRSRRRRASRPAGPPQTAGHSRTSCGGASTRTTTRPDRPPAQSARRHARNGRFRRPHGPERRTIAHDGANDSHGLLDAADDLDRDGGTPKSARRIAHRMASHCNESSGEQAPI